MRKAKFFHLLAYTTLLVACATYGLGVRQITKIKDTISSPPQSELIIDEIGTVSGTNECYAVMNSLVYGSQQTYDEIVAHYQAELTKHGWIDESSKYDQPVFSKGHRLSMAILDRNFDKSMVYDSWTAVKSLLAARAPEFKTLYGVDILYSTCLDQ